MKSKLLIFFLYFLLENLYGQIKYPINGSKDISQNPVLINNGNIHLADGTVLQAHDMLIQNEIIVEISKTISPKKEWTIYHADHLEIYPSFIDLYQDFCIKKVGDGNRYKNDQGQILNSDKPNYFHWNQAIHPEVAAINSFEYNEDAAKSFRSIGFGIILTHIMDGIVRGTGVCVTTGTPSLDRTVILKNNAAQILSFSKGLSPQSYPTSQMGSIALLRQLYFDSGALNTKTQDENLSLKSWKQNKPLPQLCFSSNWLELVRFEKIGQEFGQKLFHVTSSDGYKNLAEMQKIKNPIVLYLNFSKVPDHLNLNNINKKDYSDLLEIVLAPKNAYLLDSIGLEFALTSYSSKNGENFKEKLIKLLENGMSKEKILKSLTSTPAKILDLSDKIGSLEVGKYANFFISEGDFFEKKSKIIDHVIGGIVYPITDYSPSMTSGNYILEIEKSSKKFNLSIDKSIGSIKGSKAKINFVLKDGLLSFDTEVNTLLVEAMYFIGYRLENNFEGYATNSKGVQQSWTLTFLNEVKPIKGQKIQDSTKPKIAFKTPQIPHPFSGYGNIKIPTKEDVILKNATIWTNEKEGILNHFDIYLERGKIVEINKDIDRKGVKIIDCSGKHITSGLIDEHSHIAISNGVNEAGLACTAEVRISDVLNSEDINIYRQLAGGITTSQLLHGSANPIGGQSAIIKLKWGESPQNLIFKEAPNFIKFALGENVKQTNWGPYQKNRYPISRMGVEQVFEDFFSQAKDYLKATKTGIPFQRDLKLEALAEILEGKRQITCHAYQQGEMNMLIKIAEKYNFKINTFTHVLEGYKIADKIKAHGASASTFSDWWGYKYEVEDAIPYNGAILNSQGVNTGFNSDDAEMARRLNQEAAKAIKYGNVSEEDALKLVTLNPAKMLHIDHLVGSIKVGKDADLVVWSHHPLSVYSLAELTFIDGVIYFDRKKDLNQRTELLQKKLALFQIIKSWDKEDDSKGKKAKKNKSLYHCDSIEEE